MKTFAVQNVGGKIYDGNKDINRDCFGLYFARCFDHGGSFLFVHFTVDENYRKAVAEKKIEGANFGKTTDQAGCFSEGMKRSEKITLVSPMKDQSELESFVESCLPESRPTKDFCEGVPADYALPADRTLEKPEMFGSRSGRRVFRLRLRS